MNLLFTPVSFITLGCFCPDANSNTPLNSPSFGRDIEPVSSSVKIQNNLYVCGELKD
jgi:hypothetical protein